jgi:hypothetical protein
MRGRGDIERSKTEIRRIISFVAASFMSSASLRISSARPRQCSGSLMDDDSGLGSNLAGRALLGRPAERRLNLPQCLVGERQQGNYRVSDVAFARSLVRSTRVKGAPHDKEGLLCAIGVSGLTHVSVASE